MKIAATVSTPGQVGIDQYRDFNYTKVFDVEVSVKEIIAWAELKTNRKNIEICDIKLSMVEE